MSWFQVIVYGLILIAVVTLIALLVTFFKTGFKKPTPQKSAKRDWDYIEYWDAHELNVRELEMYPINENMAAVEGHHKLKHKSNVIPFIITERSQSSKWEREI